MQHGWLVGLLTGVIVMIFLISELTLPAFGVALHAFGVTFWGSLGPIRCVWAHLEDLGRVPGSSLGHLVRAWEVSGRILKSLGVISGTFSVPKISKKYSWNAFG